MNISIIVNPYARKNFKNPRIVDKFKEIIGEKGTVFFSQNLDDLESLIKEIKKKSSEYIGISGGDGTLMHTISRIIKVYGEQEIPPILILKGGTMNMAANSVKLKGSQIDILERFYLSYESAETVERDMIKVNNYYCFIFGLGIVSNFLDTYYDGKGTGPVKAAKITGKLIGSAAVNGPFSQNMLASLPIDFEINGETFPRKNITAVLAQTIENLGIGFKPMYRALEKKGTFHILLTELPLNKIIKYVPNIFFGTPIKDKGFTDRLAREVKLKSPKPFKYTMDGDLFENEENNELILKYGKTLRFVVV